MTKNYQKTLIKALLVLVSLQCFSTPLYARKIQLLVQLIHYGASTPSRIFHNETSEIYNWIDKYRLNELTPVGTRQMYLLGLQTYRNYSSLFNSSNISKDQIYLRAKGKNKTYHSSMIIAQGLFKDVFPRRHIVFNEMDEKLRPPNKIENEEIIRTGTDDPLPGGPLMLSIVRKSRFYDELLELGGIVSCPSLDLNRQATDEEKKLRPQVDLSFINELIDQLDLNIEKDASMISCFKVSKFVYANYYSNPLWNDRVPRSTDAWKKLTRCYQATGLALMGNETSIKIAGSPLVEKILGFVKERHGHLTAGRPNKGLKYSHFIGNEPNFVRTLTVLGIFNRSCVIKMFVDDKREECVSGSGYGTALNFEYFYDDEAKKGEINIKYKSSSRNVCGNKAMLESIGLTDIYHKYNQIYSEKNSEGYFCDLDDFIRIVEKRIYKDWATKCNLSSEIVKNASPINSVASLVFLFVANLVMLSVLYFLFQFKRKKKPRVSQVSYRAQNSQEVKEEEVEEDPGVYYGEGDEMGYESFDFDDKYGEFKSSLGGRSDIIAGNF